MMASQADATGCGGAGVAGGERGGVAPPELALDTYDMTGNKYLLILNHFKFQDTSYFRATNSEPLEPRIGTAQDVAALAAAFSALGFAVTTHHDRTHEQIVDIIAKFCASEHSSTACAAVAVLTHGEEHGLLAAADKFYALRDLLAPLQGAALVGRPKLLLLQACRGHRRDDGLQLDGDAAGLRTGSHADTLIFYSTVECFVSWRAENGSWAMQELCRVLRDQPALDALHAATLATHNVTRKYVSSHCRPNNHKKKQTPETCSTLTKLLRFTPPAAPPAPPAPPAPSPPAPVSHSCTSLIVKYHVINWFAIGTTLSPDKPRAARRGRGRGRLLQSPPPPWTARPTSPTRSAAARRSGRRRRRRWEARCRPRPSPRPRRSSIAPTTGSTTCLATSTWSYSTTTSTRRVAFSGRSRRCGSARSATWRASRRCSRHSASSSPRTTTARTTRSSTSSPTEHSRTSCVCVCVLTHGAARGELLAADRPYELRDLLAPLQATRALAGRPKLLLVQACRGEELDAGQVALDGGPGAVRLGSHADTLILTSSVEDYVSWRDANGSWLIQELCRVLEATHRHLDLLQMTALVTSLVTRERASNTPSARALHGMKQTPETRSTLTKLLRFSPPSSPPPPPTADQQRL